MCLRSMHWVRDKRVSVPKPILNKCQLPFSPLSQTQTQTAVHSILDPRRGAVGSELFWVSGCSRQLSNSPLPPGEAVASSHHETLISSWASLLPVHGTSPYPLLTDDLQGHCHHCCLGNDLIKLLFNNIKNIWNTFNENKRHQRE